MPTSSDVTLMGLFHVVFFALVLMSSCLWRNIIQLRLSCQLSDLNRVEEVLMLNFILKNTEIQAVPEECGHATVISITELNWYNYTVVGVTAR